MVALRVRSLSMQYPDDCVHAPPLDHTRTVPALVAWRPTNFVHWFMDGDLSPLCR